MNEEIQQAFDNLNDINSIMERLAILYTLDGGTLLGAHRDQDFCQDDHNDIDLTIPFDQDRYVVPVRDLAMNILEEATKMGFVLYHYWRKQEKTTAQLSLMRGKSKVDIMFKERLGIKAWWTIYGGKNGITYKAVPLTHFFGDPDFERVTLRGRHFLAPNHCEDYLTTRYGDWETPVHASKFSCYNTDKSIIKSYEEI